MRVCGIDGALVRPGRRTFHVHFYSSSPPPSTPLDVFIRTPSPGDDLGVMRCIIYTYVCVCEIYNNILMYACMQYIIICACVCIWYYATTLQLQSSWRIEFFGSINVLWSPPPRTYSRSLVCFVCRTVGALVVYRLLFRPETVYSRRITIAHTHARVLIISRISVALPLT